MAKRQNKTNSEDKKNILGIVTYNIQACNKIPAIVRNIQQLAQEGTAIFCLQEVRFSTKKPFIGDVLQQHLGKNWKLYCFFYDQFKTKDLGICILWNTDIVQVKDFIQIFLPRLLKKSLLEGFEERFMGAHRVVLRRRALTATCTFAKKTIRISNIHLDWQGGWEHRKKQLQFLTTELQKQPKCEKEIICGDFNTTKWPFPAHEEPLIATLFGKRFTNVSESIKYTSDLNSSSFYNWLNIIWNTMIRLLQIHIYQKVDHIWSRGIAPLHVTLKKLQGSDHFPLLATFMVGPSEADAKDLSADQ